MQINVQQWFFVKVDKFFTDRVYVFGKKMYNKDKLSVYRKRKCEMWGNFYEKREEHYRASGVWSAWPDGCYGLSRVREGNGQGTGYRYYMTCLWRTGRVTAQ